MDKLESPEAYAVVMVQSAKVFGILMFCFLSTITMYVFSTLLTANGNLRQLNLIAFAGIIINFSLNILLIPGLMATGSAIASLFTQSVTAIAYAMLVQYYFRFRINVRFISKLVVYTLAVIGISFLSRYFPFSWIISLGIIVTASLLLAFGIRLVSIKSMIMIIRSRED
jgi:O-antigen/teichoic acid export membrane protein